MPGIYILIKYQYSKSNFYPTKSEAPPIHLAMMNKDTTALDRAVLHNPTVIVMIGLLLRCCVGLHPHSGLNDPPTYGEFEAQRHMLEIAFSLPLDNWYVNGTGNDLSYWGISYPPVAAYVAWLWGHLAHFVIPDLVELKTSQGLENEDARAFMRASVVVLDLFLFIPALWCFCIIYYGNIAIGEDDDLKGTVGQFLLYSSRTPTSTKSPRHNKIIRRRRESESSFSSGTLTLPVALVSEVFLLILLQPSFVLIDHGHFHYSVLYLGLLVWMIVVLMRGHIILATCIFCLALNANQVTFAYSPVILLYLFCCTQGACFKSRLFNNVKVISAGVFTFGLLWGPFCLWSQNWTVDTCQRGLSSVLQQVVPITIDISRASIYSFFPSSFNSFPQDSKIFLSLALTYAGLLPCCIDFIRKSRSPGVRRLLWGLFNASLTFFIAFFHVHPRGILLPLLPASLLAGEVPGPSCWFSIGAIFSLAPLLFKDNLGIAYFVSTSVFVATSGLCFRREICFLPLPWIETRFYAGDKNRDTRYGIRMINVTGTLQVASAIGIFLNIGLVRSEAANVEFWESLHNIFAVTFFIAAWFYGNWYQWWIPDDYTVEKSKTE